MQMRASSYAVSCTVTCLACCRPSWFEKYRNSASRQLGRTILHLAADRSAMVAGSIQEQQQRGFASAFYGMLGCASYAGYDSYLSKSFGNATSPGLAMVKHLLAGGAVNSYAGVSAADNITKARFRSMCSGEALHYQIGVSTSATGTLVRPRRHVLLMRRCVMRCRAHVTPRAVISRMVSSEC
jgi:hypothetical protein